MSTAFCQVAPKEHEDLVFCGRDPKDTGYSFQQGMEHLCKGTLLRMHVKVAF